MSHATFGPGGNGDLFYAEGYKSTMQAFGWLKSYGLDAYEYEAGNGITASDATLRAIGEKAREHGILMSPVSGLGNAEVVLILCSKVRDDLPGEIFAAIIDKQNSRIFRNQSLPGKILNLLQKLRCSNGQHLLLVVAGNHDPEHWFFRHT